MQKPNEKEEIKDMRVKKILCTLMAAQILATAPGFAIGKKTEEVVVPKNFPKKYDAKYIERITP